MPLGQQRIVRALRLPPLIAGPFVLELLEQAFDSLCDGAVMKLKKVSKSEASERLKDLPGWTLDGDDAIAWDFTFRDFDEAIDAINAIADIARDLQHHPELTNLYNQVGLRLTTHDVDGLSERDFKFAERVNDLDTVS